MSMTDALFSILQCFRDETEDAVSFPSSLETGRCFVSFELDYFVHFFGHVSPGENVKEWDVPEVLLDCD